MELNCWVLGDPSDRIFHVTIAADKSVGDLKYAIKDKKKPAFDHVPADTLVLWNVSVSDIHSLPEKPSDIEFAKEKLAPMDELSKVFSGVSKEGRLHIIVNAPTIGKCS